MPDAEIPVVYVIVNGPVLAGARDGLGMGRGKQWSMAFQACERLFEEIQAEGLDTEREIFYLWRRHTTTITRVATTDAMWERVKTEVPGTCMVDEGYTEVTPDSEIAWVAWPMLPGNTPKILANAKVPLLGDDTAREREAFMAGWDLAPDSDQYASRDLEQQAQRAAHRDWRAGSTLSTP